MTQDDTCGTGMAAQSEFPALMGDTTATMAQVLRLHTAALRSDDPAGAAEIAAWNEIAAQGADVAGQLRKLAQSMTQCRDLPVAEHDMAPLTSPESIQAFRDFAAAQQALRDRLNQAVAENDAMLRALDGDGDGEQE